jgi:WD40 repeat protein
MNRSFILIVTALTAGEASSLKASADEPAPEQLKRYNAVAQSNRTILRAVWGRYDDREEREFGHQNRVVFSPDGKRALLGKTRYSRSAGKVSSSLQLWDVFENKLIHSVDLQETWILALALAPDNRRALSAVQVHGKGRGTVNTLWDLAERKPLRTWQSGTVVSLAFSPNARQALSGAALGTIEFRDLRTGKHLGNTTQQLGSQSAVHFLPDGKRALSFTNPIQNNGPITLWDLAGGMKEIRSVDHGSPVMDLALTPDGTRALSMGSGSLKLWDVEQGKEIRTIRAKELELTSAVCKLAISPDGKRAVTILYRYRPFGADSEVYSEITAVDLEAGKRLWTAKERHSVSRALFHPDGRHILVANGAHGFSLWDIASGRETRSWGGHLAPVTSLAYLPSAKQALSAGEDEKLKLWDVATGKEIASFRSHDEAITSVAISRDGKRAVSGSADQTVRMWDLSVGKEVGTLKGHTKAVTTVAWTSEGEQVLSGSADGTLRLWHAKTAKEIWVAPAHAQGVTALSLSPDGRTAVSAGENGTLKLWAVGTERPGEPRTLSGHERAITCVAFAPDGRRLLSGSEDHSLKLWDVAKREVTKTLLGHQNWVRAVAFSPDGQRILSASDDLTIRLWDAATGKELDQIDLGQSGDAPRALAFAPDGRSFLVGTMNWVILHFELKDAR